MDSRQRVAIVVAHELAHQWFGNLVVCHFIFEINIFDFFCV
jgi:aminopeptidase N